MLQTIIVFLLFGGAIAYIGRLIYKSIFLHEKTGDICKDCAEYTTKKKPVIYKRN